MLGTNSQLSLFKWNYFILDNKVKWNIHNIWPISVENVRPYIGTGCTLQKLEFLIYPTNKFFHGAAVVPKKVQEPLGVEVCQTECISFFPVTIFKNLQPSDFFTLRLNTPTWSYRKKKACNRWINGNHCSHGYLPREHSCHFFMHLQTKSPDWIHHGGNANYNRLKESLVPWKVFSGTTSCGNAARASLSAERTRDATVLSGG